MIKVTAKYPREIVYVMSCQDLKSGRLFFFGLDDFSKLIFPLGIYEDFNDSVYEKVINDLLNDKTFKEGKGKFNLVVGFGEQVCLNLAPKISSIHGNIVYDPDLAIESSWGFVQNAFKGNALMNLKPVSLAIRKVDTWIKFLNPEFITKVLPVPKEFSSDAKVLLTDFKEQFQSGIEHVAFVSRESTDRILNLTPDETQGLLSELQEIPDHNGIIYLDLGNGFTSDFVYRLTHFNEGINIVCFRQESERGPRSLAVCICSFTKGGAFLLHSPSGMGDSYNTAKLVSIVMRPNKVLKEVFVNYNKEMFGLNATKENRLIPVAKYLYVGNKKLI
jgi:hypothetical protein